MKSFISGDINPLKRIFKILNNKSNNIALVINKVSYTYKNLFDEVDKFYEIIKNLQLQNVVIAVSADLSFEMHATMLAIIKSGNCILPFNEVHPVKRLKNSFDTADVSIIFINSRSTTSKLLVEECDENTFYCFKKKLLISKAKELEKRKFQKGIIYILFTSGSTGVPKAVPVSERNLNYLLNFYLDIESYDFDETDHFLQVYEPTFDVFYFSFLLPLCIEATCYVMENETHVPKYIQIIDELKKNDITVVSMVPTVLMYMQRFLDELQFPSLRYSFFSGDALLNSIAKKWLKCLPNGVIHNFYGPTETTIVCTRYIYDESLADEESFNNVVPLGVSFPWMDFIIVNDYNERVLIEEIGELCFSGSQVIDNYLNNENYESFFSFNFNDNVLKFYKTGDLVFVNKKGNLVFAGRKDFQIKMNGYRVDLLEIEGEIYKITNSLVASVAKNNYQGFLQIVVFIEDENIKVDDVYKKLADVLPAYLMPSKIIPVKKIPINSNDKIDKQALYNLIK